MTVACVAVASLAALAFAAFVLTLGGGSTGPGPDEALTGGVPSVEGNTQAASETGVPAETEPNGFLRCPQSHPLKGNVSAGGDKIFHRPQDDFYNRTKPERCFFSTEAAEAEGFRLARR